MVYEHCARTNFEDLASGRVLYGDAGIPNFPARLANEIFGRCLSRRSTRENLTVVDPCCGGGYLLTVLGLCNPAAIGRVAGSDIDGAMVSSAKRNFALLTRTGLDARVAELDRLIALYGRQSHKDARESALRLRDALPRDIPSLAFEADCTKPSPAMPRADIIITDVPYGNLVSWQGADEEPLARMLEALTEIADADTVLAISMDKRQKLPESAWQRLEKQNIGKRKFVLLKRRDP